MDASIALSTGYMIGAIIALLILFYLSYSLIKPEKF
jgi:K+-transporting ATPase KdpF subunit